MNLKPGTCDCCGTTNVVVRGYSAHDAKLGTIAVDLCFYCNSNRDSREE